MRPHANYFYLSKESGSFVEPSGTVGFSSVLLHAIDGKELFVPSSRNMWWFLAIRRAVLEPIAELFLVAVELCASDLSTDPGQQAE